MNWRVLKLQRRLLAGWALWDVRNACEDCHYRLRLNWPRKRSGSASFCVAFPPLTPLWRSSWPPDSGTSVKYSIGDAGILVSDYSLDRCSCPMPSEEDWFNGSRWSMYCISFITEFDLGCSSVDVIAQRCNISQALARRIYHSFTKWPRCDLDVTPIVTWELSSQKRLLISRWKWLFIGGDRHRNDGSAGFGNRRALSGRWTPFPTLFYSSDIKWNGCIINNDFK